MREILLRRPSGLCERHSIDELQYSELTPTGQSTVLRGWGDLDGPADEYTGPAAGEYLVPRQWGEHYIPGALTNPKLI